MVTNTFLQLLQPSATSAPSSSDLDIVVLDGGLGTTLRDTFKRNCEGDLWSSRLLAEDPDVIKQAHLAFFEAGAEIVLTCTYQAFIGGFVHQKFTEEEARGYMNKAVDLAAEARDEYVNGDKYDKATSKKLAVGLSLGSYGAILCNGEEFTGAYPESEQSVAYLKEFHLDRLRVFLPSFPRIDFIAFETTPLANEVIAIRQAMTELSSLSISVAGGGDIPFWIGLTCPAGEWADKGGAKAARESLWEGPGRLPDGVALNCTETSVLASIIPHLAPSSSSESKPNKPTLILYPNYNTAYMNETDNAASYWDTFDKGSKPARLTGPEWASQLISIASEANSSGSWASKIICGGCCGTQPDEISELRKLADGGR
ncbi:Homocysteine S-methyltransferase [Phaffia rhodozyma]|uniref:Homocysteine S-methyltransferase n=1 Tax=Phaffia rhodozyma TaxID=264483 RepID=A0A0F7SKP1_PHARH|nr:Homocysteine S-methyltransferase [Phaffia rhodozyma]